MQRAHARYREVLQSENGLTASARLVCCYLISRADWDTGQVYVRQDTIAAELGLGRTTVSGVLRELRDGGWLTWERTTPTMTTYTLKPHHEVRDPWVATPPVKPLPRKRKAARKPKAESKYEAHDVQNPNIVKGDRPAESEHRDVQIPNIVEASDVRIPNIRPAESEHQTAGFRTSDVRNPNIHIEQRSTNHDLGTTIKERESATSAPLALFDEPEPTPKRTTKRRITEDYRPRPETLEWAVAKLAPYPWIELATEGEKFVNRNLADSGTSADWDRNFRTWVLNAIRYQPEAPVQRHAAQVSVTLPGGQTYAPQAEDSLSRVRRQFRETAEKLAAGRDDDGRHRGPGAPRALG